MFWPNLKFIALSVPEIIVGTQKIGQNFLWPFARIEPANVPVRACTSWQIPE